MKTLPVLAVVATVLVLVVGCSGGTCPAVRFPTASAAVQSYGAMRAQARVIRAEARVDRRDAEGRIRGTVLMFIERPDRVRFDAMTQLGPAAVLTSDGQTFALTDLRDDRFYVGPTCPANIERLIGLPLAGDQVTLLLLGETPRIEAVSEEIACDEGTYRIALRDAAGRTQQIDLEVLADDAAQAPERQRMRLRRTEVHAPDGALEWRVGWDDYQLATDPGSGAAGGVWMPHRIRFEQPSRGIDTLVRFESIDLNVEVPTDAFVQQPREGLAVETVTCD